MKAAVALGSAVVVAGGLGIASLTGGGGSAPKHPSSQATATTVVAVASAQDVANSVVGLTQQLQQAANNNGSPRVLSQEEVHATIQAELAKLGIKL